MKHSKFVVIITNEKIILTDIFIQSLKTINYEFIQQNQTKSIQ